MKFEIDIDLPEDILREWEPVAIRPAAVGEFVLFMNHEVKECPADNRREPSLILRRRFVWPAWLKCRYVTWDCNGTANMFNARPELGNFAWCSHGLVGCVHEGAIDLHFPGGDWRTRIEENPNWKE